MINLDIRVKPTEWLQLLEFKDQVGDYIVLCDNEDKMVWFTSNLSNLIIQRGSSEVGSIYGKQIVDLDSLCYQLSFCFPWGFQIGRNLNALYDLLLNFETEPEERVLFWNDAQHFKKINDKLFTEVFETMVVAAYSNRKGLSSVKENHEAYRVNQRNFLVFQNTLLNEVMPLVNNKYYVPGFNSSIEKKVELDFLIVNI